MATFSQGWNGGEGGKSLAKVVSNVWGEGVHPAKTEFLEAAAAALEKGWVDKIMAREGSEEEKEGERVR